MSTSSPQHRPSPMAGFDASMDRWLGADMRLLYGMAAPVLMVTGLIIVLALSPAAWLVGAILVAELILAGVVLTGFVGMLNEDEQPDDR